MNKSEVKATAKGAADMYVGLTPNLKVMVGRLFESELSLTYRVQSEEVQPQNIGAYDRDSIENFFLFLDSLLNTWQRHFQRGYNSKQLIQLALSNMERS